MSTYANYVKAYLGAVTAFLSALNELKNPEIYELEKIYEQLDNYLQY